MYGKKVTAIQRQFLQRVAGGKAERVSLVEDRATRLARTLHQANRILIFVRSVENEAPRSKLRGITELKHVELPEIIAGLSLPLHIPLDCLPVRSLSSRGHIGPIGPKFSTPQHSFDGRLPAKDFPGREALEYLHNPPSAMFGWALQRRWM